MFDYANTTNPCLSYSFKLSKAFGFTTIINFGNLFIFPKFFFCIINYYSKKAVSIVSNYCAVVVKGRCAFQACSIALDNSLRNLIFPPAMPFSENNNNNFVVMVSRCLARGCALAGGFLGEKFMVTLIWKRITLS
jgi:hypothetical protein